MSERRIAYAPRADATPGAEISALANVFRFVLDTKEAAPENRPEAGKEFDEHSGKRIIPER